MISADTINLPYPRDPSPTWYVVDGYSKVHEYIQPLDLILMCGFATFLSFILLCLLFDNEKTLEISWIPLAATVLTSIVSIAWSLSPMNPVKYELKGNEHTAAYSSPGQAKRELQRARSNNTDVGLGSIGVTKIADKYQINATKHPAKGTPTCWENLDCDGRGTTYFTDGDINEGLHSVTEPGLLKRANDLIAHRYGAHPFDNTDTDLIPDNQWTIDDLTGARVYSLRDGTKRRCIITYSGVKMAKAPSYVANRAVASFKINKFICTQGPSKYNIIQPTH